MLILLTGGTGYLGSHTTAALVRAGHRVRLLVRGRGGVAAALGPLDIDPAAVRQVRGDVTDPEVVARAADGCDAVVHLAGRYSFDSRRHRGMWDANVRGTEVVLRAARTARLDPIVHVSTFGALAPGPEGTITVDSPAAKPRETYLASKVAAELVARRHQDEGAPVVITYPLATLGPADPHLGDQVTRVRDTLRGLMPMWPTGGFPIGDVRDVARLHTAVLEPGQGPRRFLAPGHYVTTRKYLAILREVTGRRLPAIHLPVGLMLPVTALASAAQRLIPARIPAQYGAVYACAVSRPVDNRRTSSLLGDEGQPLTRTMTDTVRWLNETGRITAAAAGRAALT
ncbi:NAD-dependent epimerase/dehydratase family protein [Salinispora cortesiana]|uniref:NAD-dependent epimerase/dehydratase family protein n=1 Tax=Salinispora cortesiana TaxID=1305843 RepID=UPI000421AA24|nr:NAD-dependent epimerase/dehydratase family protein [Salinispora cortesiana]